MACRIGVNRNTLASYEEAQAGSRKKIFNIIQEIRTGDLSYRAGVC
jgi:hypothetical protein